MLIAETYRGLTRYAVIARPRCTRANAWKWITLGILVFLWQASRPVMADIENPGYSENEFFRLDWEYDLEAGTGWFSITPTNDQYPRDFLLLQYVDFVSGAPFDTYLDGHYPITYDVEPVGDGYRYTANNVRHWLEYRKNEVTFPTTEITLRESTFEFAGFTSAGMGAIPIPPSAMNFVTIDAVPEPAAATMLGAGLVGLGLTARLRREQKIFE